MECSNLSEYLYYCIDWQATGTWGILIVGILGLIYARRQINANRDLKRIELTEKYLTKYDEYVDDGLFDQAVNSYLDDASDKLIHNREGVTLFLRFFERFSLLYNNNFFDKSLVRVTLRPDLEINQEVLKSIVIDVQKESVSGRARALKDIPLMVDDILGK